MNYTYGDANWPDLLTAFNGKSITYDAIGNPLSDGTWTYTWQHGRQLASMSKSGSSITYGYNADGKRISKTVNGTTYNFSYLGDQLTEMTWGSNKLHFTYDSTGPASVTYNGNRYFYLKNAQGDVTGLVNASGTQVVSYTYDPWGAPMSVSGSMSATLGAVNPLRYRGYVYDTETGLYYLSSRYYNPTWGRFINADGYASTGQGFDGHNMFAYCGNEPVNRYDVGGMFWKEAIRGITHAINNAGIGAGIDTAAVGAFFLDMYRDDKGIYHASFDCWQQYFGYNDMYDFFFDLGTSCKPAKFSFTYNGQEYVIWAWKGDYINLGAGAELGIYTGGEPHWHVDKSLAMSMYVEVKYNGSTIISFSDYTWWITGFNPNYQNMNASSLTAIFTIRLNDPGMYNAFRASRPAGWTFALMQGFGIARFYF